MGRIQVYLQRPWVFADSPYYDYLTRNVSDKIEYVNLKGNQGIVENIKKFKLLNKSKRIVKLTIRNLFPWLPNSRFTRTSEKYDIIHCAHCLSSSKKPWVMDIEYVNQFWAGGIPKKQKRSIRELLNSSYCKKILAWTEWTKNSILEHFPEIESKIEVVYPAIQAHKVKRKNKKIRLLFVSRRFFFKGGLHALEVMDRVTKRYQNVEALIISDTPKEVVNRYSMNKRIRFLDFLSKEKLFSEIYPKTDILVYPSYTDTFGFIILEALSFGIPIVTVGGQSRNDLVINGKTGFVITGPKDFNVEGLENLDKYKGTIDEIEKKVEFLVSNRKVRNKMSENAVNEVLNGRFSIKRRNKMLEKIYSEAIK